jgi:3-hydroxybutyrate dehydrogenase
MSTSTLAGKHAVVTGGGRGIGEAIAAALLEQGACVTIAGRDEANLQNTVRQLLPKGKINYVTVDVADSASVQQAFEHATVRLGRVDILVNNAGQARSAPFQKTDAQLWQQMLAVNLTGTFHCTQQVLLLRRQARRDWLDAFAGAGSRQQRRDRERNLPWLYRNRYCPGRSCHDSQ